MLLQLITTGGVCIYSATVNVFPSATKSYSLVYVIAECLLPCQFERSVWVSSVHDKCSPGVLQEEQTDVSLWNARRSVLVLMRLCQKNCRSTAIPITLSFKASNVVIKRSNCKIINEAQQTKSERRTGRSLKKVSAGQEKAAYSSTNSCSSHHTNSGLQARGGEWLPEPGQQLNPKQTSPTTVESSSFLIPARLVRNTRWWPRPRRAARTFCCLRFRCPWKKSEVGTRSGWRPAWPGCVSWNCSNRGRRAGCWALCASATLWFLSSLLGESCGLHYFPWTHRKTPHLMTAGNKRYAPCVCDHSCCLCFCLCDWWFEKVSWSRLRRTINHHSFMHLSGPAFFFFTKAEWLNNTFAFILRLFPL